jgi:CrcB protein
MTRFLLVCLGGAIGSGARYLVALSGLSQPTLIVNVAGSFLIAVVMGVTAESELRFFLVTGILGGFTTYSAFNQETLQMMRTGAAGAALLNLAVTVIGCLAAGFAGVFVVRLLTAQGH